MTDNFRLLLINTLAYEKRVCSNEDIETLVNIFGEYVKNYPRKLCTQDGAICNGFYLPFLHVIQHETEPIPFYKILEIDSKIGWVNPIHLEGNIFYYKATKIIKDQKVS